MKATNCLMRDLFVGTKQYVVPLFQRSYVWGSVQWEQFWSDITEKYLCKVESNCLLSELFFGSIVVVRDERSGLEKLMIIDGQQRLTTVSIFLAVLREFAKRQGDTVYVEEISCILKRERSQTPAEAKYHSPEDLHSEPREFEPYIVIPTRVDKASLYQILNEDYAFNSDSRIIECFEYFSKCLDNAGYDIATLYDVLMNSFCLVYIELRDDESPNQVFEALNYRGIPLDEADLIRNFFFSKIKPVKSAEEAYHQYWKPMEHIFDHRQNLLSSFLRTFFMRNGDFIKKGELFDIVRRKFHTSSSESIISLLRTLLHDAPYYHYLVEPSDLSGGGPVWRSIQSRLERLLFLGAESVYPFLLHCFSHMPAFSDDLFEALPESFLSSSKKENEISIISLSEFDGILAILETYFVRRELCQKNRQDYDQLFCSLCPQKGEQVSRELVISMLASLPVVYACPSSDEFEDTLRGEIYIEGADNRVIWVIMTSLEEFFRKYPHHELVGESKTKSDVVDQYMLFEEYDDDFIIDHIMPLELSDWWKSHLGESWPVIHHEYVNTLGNLTLTIRNPLLSRANFEQKQRWYVQDQMALNNPIRQVRMWRKIQVEQRSQSLIALCLKIWPDITKHSPFIPVSYADCGCLRVGDIPSHLHPLRVVIRGQEMPVRYWYQVLEWTVETLYAAEERKFPRIPERYPRIFSEDPTHFKSIIGKWSYHSRLGRYQIRDLCLGMLEALGWKKDDWCLVCE
jgi:hypothetical protein